MNHKEAILSLETLSLALEEVSIICADENEEFAQHLSEMSWQMYKCFKELSNIEYIFEASKLTLMKKNICQITNHPFYMTKNGKFLNS